MPPLRNDPHKGNPHSNAWEAWWYENATSIDVYMRDKEKGVTLPVPSKSSCWFCPSMKPDEVRALPADKLCRIVVLEARAKPRLVSIEGLWRKPVKGTRGGIKKPGSMTEFIRDEGLLPAAQIDHLIESVPQELISRNEAFAEGEEVPGWEAMIASYAPTEECCTC